MFVYVYVTKKTNQIISILFFAKMEMGLEAFPVDNGRSGLVVLLLGDPHVLEGGEGGEDGSSDPD